MLQPKHPNAALGSLRRDAALGLHCPRQPQLISRALNSLIPPCPGSSSSSSRCIACMQRPREGALLTLKEEKAVRLAEEHFQCPTFDGDYFCNRTARISCVSSCFTILRSRCELVSDWQAFGSQPASQLASIANEDPLAESLCMIVPAPVGLNSKFSFFLSSSLPVRDRLDGSSYLLDKPGSKSVTIRC